MKILHVVENLGNGAVENWLVNLFLETRKYKPEWQWIFYCILPVKGKLEDKALENGAIVIYSQVRLSNKIKFLLSFRKLLNSNDYDIVHVHHDYLSGFYLLAVIGLKQKCKIIFHLHNQERTLPTNKVWLKNIAINAFKSSALYFSDEIWANSTDTLKDFLADKKFNKKAIVFELGLNISDIAINKSKEWLKDELKIPVTSKNLVFVGRLYDLKNPLFCIEILKALLKIRSDVFLLFVGEGEQKDEIRDKSILYGIEGNVKFLGYRGDIFNILFGCDLMLFPRKEKPMEGFGLNVLEAQIVGLKSLISFGVPIEVKLIESLVYYFSLEKSSYEWAMEANKILNEKKIIDYPDTLAVFSNSKYDIRNNAINLIERYIALKQF